MDQRLEELEKAVKALEAAVRQQDERIAALEGGIDDAPAVRRDVSETRGPADPVLEVPSDHWTVSTLKGTPAFIGRSLLILAGAFLLRALTEAGTFVNGMALVVRRWLMRP